MILRSDARISARSWTALSLTVAASPWALLGGVVQRVGDDLGDARPVGVDPDGMGRIDLQVEGTMVVAGARHDLARVGERALKADLSSRDAVTSKRSPTGRARCPVCRRMTSRARAAFSLPKGA